MDRVLKKKVLSLIETLKEHKKACYFANDQDIKTLKELEKFIKGLK